MCSVMICRNQNVLGFFFDLCKHIFLTKCYDLFFSGTEKNVAFRCESFVMYLFVIKQRKYPSEVYSAVGSLDRCGISSHQKSGLLVFGFLPLAYN